MLVMVSCGYHLRTNNSIAENHPQIKLSITTQSMLKRPLINALISSGVKLVDKSVDGASDLVINKDSLRKVIQSIGANNQVQEYRLEYDIQFTISGENKKSIHIEKDYSFDVQQIGGGQQEEVTLRKQLANDMAWAIIRHIDATINTSDQ